MAVKPAKKRQFADIDWLSRDTESVAKGAGIAALSQSGDSIMLTCMLGVVRFSRDRDREAVAQSLETAARMVRESIA